MCNYLGTGGVKCEMAPTKEICLAHRRILNSLQIQEYINTINQLNQDVGYYKFHCEKLQLLNKYSMIYSALKTHVNFRAMKENKDWSPLNDFFNDEKNKQLLTKLFKKDCDFQEEYRKLRWERNEYMAKHKEFTYPITN